MKSKEVPTPRTDIARFVITRGPPDKPHDEEHVDACFARTLERELAASNGLCESRADALSVMKINLDAILNVARSAIKTQSADLDDWAEDMTHIADHVEVMLDCWRAKG